ncbi:unnamed protein product, partial [Mesorhabditis spiculigera]
MGNVTLAVDSTREIPLTINQEIFTWMEYASVVGMCINLFGLWLIGFHTPKSMRDFGIALTAYQIVVLLTDILLSWILSPYFIFPVPGGYPTGWLWELGVSTQLQTSMGLALALHTEALLMIMFMLRHQAIMPATHLLKFRPRPMLCFYVALQLFVYVLVLVMSCIIFHDDDQVATKAIISNASSISGNPALHGVVESWRAYLGTAYHERANTSTAEAVDASTACYRYQSRLFLWSCRILPSYSRSSSNYRGFFVVAMFFNAFGVWVIGFHTPNTMRAYGIALTAYQILSFLTDAFLSWILSPYFIFPIPGGYPNGWLWTFGVSTQVQIVIGLSVAAHMVSLLMIMFMLRHQAIMPPTHLLKFDPSYMIGFYIGLQFLAYTHVISVSCYVFYDDDVAATKAYYLERYFMFREFLEVPRTYVFTPANGFLVVSNVFAWAIALLVLVLGASFSSFHVLHVRRHMMSEKTYNLQKKWMKNCLLQVSIPLITIVLPVVIAVIDIALDLVVIFGFLPAITFMLAWHGFCSTVVTFTLYRPYKTYVKQIFWRFGSRLFPFWIQPRTFVLSETSTVAVTKQTRMATKMRVAAANASFIGCHVFQCVWSVGDRVSYTQYDAILWDCVDSIPDETWTLLLLLRLPITAPSPLAETRATWPTMPQIRGYPNGWLWKFGVSTQVQIGIGFGIAVHMASLLMIMFMLRHQAIMPPNHLLKFDHKLMLGVYIGLQIFAYVHLITLASYVFYNDDVEATKKLYLKRYFMFRQFLEVPRCYVFTPEDGVLMMINISAWVVVLFFIVMGASFSSFHVLHVRRHLMSEKTYNLQKKWMKNCLLQVTIPLITIILPVALAVTDIILEWVALFGLIPLATFILGWHGFFSTVTTFSLYRPYKMYIKHILWRMGVKIFPCCVKPRTFVISETSTIAVTKENRRANKLRLAAANARFLSSTPVSTTMNDLG